MKLYIHSLSIGFWVGDTEMGSTVIQNGMLLEKGDHTLHESNTINVLEHVLAIFRIVVGSTKLERTRGIFHDPIHCKQDFVSIGRETSSEAVPFRVIIHYSFSCQNGMGTA